MSSRSDHDIGCTLYSRTSVSFLLVFTVLGFGGPALGAPLIPFFVDAAVEEAGILVPEQGDEVDESQEMLEKVLRRMQEAEDSIKTLSFKFVQKTKVKSTKRNQVQKGKVLFSRPRKMRIEYTGTLKQTIVSDGELIWIYTPAHDQVLIDRWENWSNTKGLPKGLMSVHNYVGDLRKKYNIRPGQSAIKGAHLLHLKPKKKSSLSFSLDLWVSKESFLPLQTKFSTKSLEIVTVLRGHQVNREIPEDQFIFIPPSDVEVLEMFSREQEDDGRR